MIFEIQWLYIVSLIVIAWTKPSSGSNSLDQFQESLKYSNISTEKVIKNYKNCIVDGKTLLGIRLCQTQLELKYLKMIEKKESKLPHNQNPILACQNADLTHSICKYQIDMIENHNKSDYVRLNIKQYNCTMNQNIYGGSSFDILYSLQSNLYECEVVDHFNSTYTVWCPTNIYFKQILEPVFKPLKKLNHSLSSSMKNPELYVACINVSILLDFEHFNAFSACGLYGYHPILLREVILPYTLFCQPYIKVISSVDTLSTSVSKLMNKPYGYWSINSKKRIKQQQQQQQQQHTWKWSAGYFHDRLSFEDKLLSSNFDAEYYMERLEQTPLLLLGESHLRYTWDYIMTRLMKKDDSYELFTNPRQFYKLYSSKFNVTYKVNLFGFQCKRSIDNILLFDMDKLRSFATQNITLVFQTGSWDINSFPVHQFILDPNGGSFCIDSFRTLKNHPLGKYVKLIWVQSMPQSFLYCKDEYDVKPRDACKLEESYMWRNNHAIQAMNEFFEYELVKLKLPNLQIIRAFDIIQSHRQYNDALCGAHWLCRQDMSANLETTPAGEVISQAIMRAAAMS